MMLHKFRRAMVNLAREAGAWSVAETSDSAISEREHDHLRREPGIGLFDRVDIDRALFADHDGSAGNRHVFGWTQSTPGYDGRGFRPWSDAHRCHRERTRAGSLCLV